MSRQLPQKPNLEYLKKQAKELLRSMRQGKLADAQHTLANEYGFATWAKLKSHVEALGLSPAEALKAAVCDSDAGASARFLSGIRSCARRSTIRCPTTASANKRCSRRYSGAIGRQSMCCCARAPTSGSERSGGRADSACWTIAIRAWLEFLMERGAVAGCALRCAAGNVAEAERVGGGGSGPRARKRWRRTDAAALRLHRGGCEVPSRERRRD